MAGMTLAAIRSLQFIGGQCPPYAVVAEVAVRPEAERSPEISKGDRLRISGICDSFGGQCPPYAIVAEVAARPEAGRSPEISKGDKVRMSGICDPLRMPGHTV